MRQVDKPIDLAACFGRETTITERLIAPHSPLSRITELKDCS